MVKPLKIGVVALSLSLLFSPVLVAHADELNDAVQQQQQVEQQQGAMKNQLSRLTVSANELKKKIADLDAQIKSAQQDLNQKQQEVDLVQKELSTKQKELAEKEAELKKEQAIVSNRLADIYIEGSMNVDYLNILIESKSLSQLLTNFEYMNLLIQYDNKIMNNLDAQKSVVSAQVQGLEETSKRVETAKEEATSAKKLLDDKKQEQQTSLQENQKSQDSLLTQIQKLEGDANSITQKIRSLQAPRSRGVGKSGVIGQVSTWAVPGYYNISSPFGYRIHPITGQRSLHTGIDIPAPQGTNVVAAGAGEVIFTGWYGAYGNTIIVDHGGSYSTLYAHLSSIGVTEEQSVKAGETIGKIGTTGYSTGPHLHFEVRVDGNPTDPQAYFR